METPLVGMLIAQLKDKTKIQSEKRNPMQTATKLLVGIAAMVTSDSQLVREWTGLIGSTE
jgi:hypothetical protein